MPTSYCFYFLIMLLFLNKSDLIFLKWNGNVYCRCMGTFYDEQLFVCNDRVLVHNQFVVYTYFAVNSWTPSALRGLIGRVFEVKGRSCIRVTSLYKNIRTIARRRVFPNVPFEFISYFLVFLPILFWFANGVYPYDQMNWNGLKWI